MFRRENFMNIFMGDNSAGKQEELTAGHGELLDRISEQGSTLSRPAGVLVCGASVHCTAYTYQNSPGETPCPAGEL
ncbi:hypothetical protein RvY_13173 [Ramazzottius varieornatus]|uniref:Uncharacterized protein n=1 Tax=Ramazzottius varieornatus TaxID=947166 RepID=A0A1D1VR14_RAMVA|nr:hypothetical protein RvY_13173 [Ramazzottius varieornatus]